MHSFRPALTLRCTKTEDVIRAVKFAGRKPGRMVTTVLGGGHSVDGLSQIEGGVLIDLSPMGGVQVDPDRRLARVQGGALWGDVDRATEAFGLVAPGGMVSETGVGGLTLDGGSGWLRRKHGLSCDNLVEAEVVCADGELRLASADSNPDLYWAIRGGGANFGIVASFTFRLHSLGPSVAFARTFYPIEELAPVMRGWRAYAAEAPEEVSSACAAFTYPAGAGVPEAIHDRPVVIVTAVHAGDAEEGVATLGPLRELGTPLADLTQAMPFTAVQAAFDPLFPRNRFRAYCKSQYLDELSDEAIDLVAGKALDRPAPRALVSVAHMGGAIAKVGAEDTAFAERSPPFLASISGLWTDSDENVDQIGWVRSAWKEIGAFESADAVSAHEHNLLRLAEVKATYDPDNFFRMNRNVAPAGRA
jgi:FAD/FMN-containing dehydrogenase